MASPVDTFKNNLFGQLKSYGDAVHDVFEQRIARPLLALKRDFSRSSSTTRTLSNQEPIAPLPQTSFITHEEILSASTPLEIIDIETNDSFKTIFDKVKNTFSPSTRRRTSDFSMNETEKSTRKHRHSSISSLSTKTSRKNRLHHFKSVSFADNIQYDNLPQKFSPCLLDKQQESIHSSIDYNIMGSIHEKTAHVSSSFENDDDEDENDFQRHFHQAIKPRRISIGNGKDLIYQDLSAEIVAYVLKHALRILEKEDEEYFLAEKEKLMNNNEHNEDFIDLK